MLAFLILLCSLAWADEPEDADPGVVSVPPGSEITFEPPTPPFPVRQQSYLLPGPYYDRALVAAENLPVCQKALDSCQETSQWALDQAHSALGLTKTQFAEDEALIEDMRTQVATLESQVLVLEEQRRKLRVQRTTAWAITGGIVLGAVTAAAIAIGN